MKIRIPNTKQKQLKSFQDLFTFTVISKGTEELYLVILNDDIITMLEVFVHTW